MKTRPDGLFFTNDLCAAACMKSLKDAGIGVPEDIAIVGFNNDTISRIVEPGLTTINYTGREMGEVAANNLITQLNDPRSAQASYTVVLASELIIRGSSAKS
jgi:LacI family transcriptional regulator